MDCSMAKTTKKQSILEMRNANAEELKPGEAPKVISKCIKQKGVCSDTTPCIMCVNPTTSGLDECILSHSIMASRSDWYR